MHFSVFAIMFVTQQLNW